MDDLARAEYPAMLANLQPAQAVTVVSERVKRINKINIDVADWFQERRRVEEQYVLGLRKLAQFRVPNAGELGVFQSPWNRITEAVENIAVSHHQFAERVEKDIENPLRAFQQRKDVMDMNTVYANLAAIAKDLEDAKDKSDRLTRKGGKASTQKVDAAISRLESSTQQWDSQAPFIFETLQALDESRINQLRDLLTQYQTHESDQAQRTQDSAVETLAQMLEISTEREIQNFVQKTTAGKPRLQTRATSTRQSSIVGSQSPAPPTPQPSQQSQQFQQPEQPQVSQPPPSTADSTAPSTAANTLTPVSSRPPTSQPPPSQALTEDNASEHNSVPSEPKPESKLRRLGTMFGGRRRQSVHGGFGQLTPQKTHSFGRNNRNVSPRASSTNLRDTNRLAALSEKPDEPVPERDATPAATPAPHEGVNGFGSNDNIMDSPIPPSAPAFPTGLNGSRGIALEDVPPPPGPPPSHQTPSSPSKDAEGFTIPAPMNDPITEAQREAAGEEADQFFKLNIQNKPLQEEDQEAKQAALSSVANSLKAGPAVRRAGTLRGRRDVRNTIYVPSPNVGESPTEGPLPGVPGSPPFVQSLSRPPAVHALASEASIAGTSDSQSVRSGYSLGSLAHVKHPEMTGPGLNTSIIETVSAVFEDGELKSATIAGEVAFVNNPSDSGEAKDQEIIRINNFSNLERIGPNRIFVQNYSPDQPDQYALDVSHLSKLATAFSYRVFADDTEAPALAQHAPLLLRPAWKPQGDKLGLLLQYQLNPASKLIVPVTLQNVVLVATYNGRASGAQTKPTGTHLKEKHLVYWRLGDVTLTNNLQKIVCRVIGAEGTEPTPGHIEARWEYVTSDSNAGSGITISRLQEGKGKGREVVEDDPFADESLARASPVPDQTWVDLPLSRKLVSGKYEGK